jgi:hypothetical protein
MFATAVAKITAPAPVSARVCQLRQPGPAPAIANDTEVAGPTVTVASAAVSAAAIA